jgi:hypothetical protein
MCPHTPPNSPRRDVDLIVRWGLLIRKCFSIIAEIRTLYCERFGLMAGGRRLPSDGFRRAGGIPHQRKEGLGHGWTGRTAELCFPILPVVTVRSCQTPILVLPDDVPAHPYAVAMETVRLAPKAEVSIYPWKEPKDLIPQAVQHVREFLRKHRPVTATR